MLLVLGAYECSLSHRNMWSVAMHQCDITVIAVVLTVIQKHTSWGQV